MSGDLRTAPGIISLSPYQWLTDVTNVKLGVSKPKASLRQPVTPWTLGRDATEVCELEKINKMPS